MTNRRTWQKAEQRVAELFGTKRRPYSGAAEGKAGDDIQHAEMFVEVKYRKAFEVLRWWREQAVAPAKLVDKDPVLIIVERGNNDLFAVVPLDRDYLYRLAGRLGPS